MSEKQTKGKFFAMLSRDAFFCACFIYLILKGLQLAPVNSDWFQPASNAFKDFDWSDIYFSKIKNLNNASIQNQNIVAINIDDANREEIAETLLKLNATKLKVLGLDLLFNGAKDSSTDALLDSSIKAFGKKIVVACYADSTSGNSIYSLQPMTIPKLADDDNLGYVNFIGGDNETVRTFYKVQDFRNRKLASFAFNTFIKYSDKGNFSAYKDQLSTDETIIPYQSLAEHFTTISYNDILYANLDLNVLTDKIVLVGFCGSGKGDNIIDDKHFTPLNENYAGKALPDMYGIYIHANIIESYITGYNIYTPPVALQVLVCIFNIFLFLLLYIYSESKELVWLFIVEIFLQILFGFFIIISAIYFFSNYGIKWDIGEMVAAIALAEPLVGFCRLILHFIGKIFNFNNVFSDEN